MINPNLQSGARDYSHLGIAKTIIHELIHAILNAETFDKGGLNATGTGLQFPNAMPQYHDIIVEKGGNLNKADHEYMARYKIDLLAELVGKYDSNRASPTDYKALAWDGLEYTERYGGTGPLSLGYSDKYMDAYRENLRNALVNLRKNEDPCGR
jgi:hypothetical protein